MHQQHFDVVLPHVAKTCWMIPCNKTKSKSCCAFVGIANVFTLNYCQRTNFRWEVYIWVNMIICLKQFPGSMNVTEKPYSKCRSSSQDIYMNYSLLFILTFCYYLYINWRLECILFKHLLHESTGFVFYLTITVTSHHYSAVHGQLTEQAMFIQ